MDEALIDAVYRREPLWNPDNDLHKNVVVLKKLWEEVAFELQRDVKIIKPRWKNLRAYFFNTHKKISERACLPEGTDNACKPWQYYETLLFLKRTVNAEEECNFSVETVEYEDDNCSVEIEEHTSQRKRKQYRTEENDELEQIKKKLKTLEKDNAKEKNDDMLFFESLLPYVSNIPLVQKLRLRSKIQDLILVELESVENNK